VGGARDDLESLAMSATIPPRLGAAITPSFRVPSSEREHPLERLVLARAEAASSPGSRADEHRLALVVEGGGMGAAVSAGMCVVLEALDLVRSFDMIVACSAGALNGAWTAAGQAAQGATNYEDLASRSFINPWRLAIGRAPIDFSLLFDGIAEQRKPLLAEALERGPEFHCLATSIDDGRLHVFSDFASTRELLRAVRASCTLPVLGGDPIEIDGRAYADGGLVESMPFQTAFGLGATHVLVLRSRERRYRKPPYRRHQLGLVARRLPGIAEVLRERPGRYNREADELEAALDQGRPDLRMIALTEPEHAVSQLERDPGRVAAGVRAGARAAAAVFCSTEVDLLWEPRLYASSLSG
jgi:predicted patatin/cPLA2 family phospholipase